MDIDEITRAAFDSDSFAEKNIALRKAHGALVALREENEQLREKRDILMRDWQEVVKDRNFFEGAWRDAQAEADRLREENERLHRQCEDLADTMRENNAEDQAVREERDRLRGALEELVALKDLSDAN